MRRGFTHLQSMAKIIDCLYMYTIYIPFLLYCKKGKQLVLQSPNCVSLLLDFSVIVVIQSGFFINMMAYPYIIMVFEIILVIQPIVVIAWSLKRSNQ